jgi:hypothetical protein
VFVLRDVAPAGAPEAAAEHEDRGAEPAYSEVS